MILPVRSFPRGKSNQLPFAGYSCIYPRRREHDPGDRYDPPSTAGHFDPRDNQEGFMKLLVPTKSFVEAFLTIVSLAASSLCDIDLSIYFIKM
ncbi:unnamed protein product [Lasius platythorax]|uniref:Uncharacterized protein n=1 Tax=Lasius platythorax TaxID=488582 RepID=A0AAV2NXP2_9HYME